MQTNNQYYKAICENMNIPIEAGVHNNNYYLKQIATVGYGKSYTGTVCNGILIKDIAEAITESTYTGHHFTNFYLKEIASALTGDDYNTEFDNYYLNIWAENTHPSESSLLNWNPPSYMEYSDFNATGLLTDEDNNPISDATVYLVVGSTKVDNAQTNSNGVVTFTGSPVHAGTHSFKLVFEGNPNYTSSESSIAEITIAKETTLLEVTSPANNSTWYDDGNILVTGSLLDNDSPDSSPVANARIWAMLSWWDNRGMQDRSMEWGKTNSAGEFSIIIPAPSYDDMSVSDKRGTLRIWYQGDDDYTGSPQENIILNIAKPSLDLVADKPILSYVDEQQTAGSQVCTVTATVNSGVSREGEIMSFTVKDSGGTVVETGSAIVDSSNQCEYEYVSKGLGDVTVEAELTVSGTLVSKTYGIVDAQLFDPMTSNSGHWTIESGMSPSYSSNGCTVSGLSSWKSMSVTEQFNTPVSMEFEIVSTTRQGGASPLIEFKGQTHQSTNDMLFAFADSANDNCPNKINITDKNGTGTCQNSVQNGVYRIDFESSTNVKIYYNDTQIYSSTNWNMSNPYFTIGTGANRSFTFKNVLIKPL